MSDPTRTLSKAIPASHSRLSAQDLKDLQGCEIASGMIKRVNNSEPYTQTIPQLPANAYHHHSQLSATQYRRETGFQRDDPEGMQYMSYIHLPAEGIIQQHAMSMSMVTNTAEQTSGSAKGTPNLGPKKVMSFNDYRKKAAGGSAAEKSNGNGNVAVKSGENMADKQTAIKGPAEKAREETREMLKAVEEMESDAEKSDVKMSKASQHRPAEAKRKRSEEMRDDLTNNAKADVPEPPAKKARLSPPRLPDTSTTATAISKSTISQPLSTAVPTTQVRTKSPSRVNGPAQPPTARDVGLPPKLSPIKDIQRKSPPPSPSRDTQELPRKLSPLHQQRRKSSSLSPPRDISQLPRKLSPLPTEPTSPETFNRLSPTLPGNILAALEQKDKTRDDAAAKDRSAPSSASKKDSMLTPNAAVNGTKHRSPAPRNGFRANSHSPAAVEAIERPSTQTSHPERQKSPIEDHDDEADQSLLVKLKIKKSRRSDMQRLLALPSGTAVHRTPRAPSVKPADSNGSVESHATAQSAAGRDAARRSGKGVAQKIVPSAKKTATAEKRPRDDSDVAEPPAKKHKTDEGPSRPQSKAVNGLTEPSSPVKQRVPEPLQLKDRSTTPAQPDLRTPTTSSASKSQLATPAATNNRLAAVAMAREPSRESIYGTPTAPAPDTPPTTTQPRSQLTSNGPTSTVADKTGVQATWDAQTAHFTSLGTSLKRAAQASHAPQPAPYTAALQALESFMAFILSFHCSDQSAQSADPPSRPALQPWRSLVPYYGFVQKHCAPFPLLAGIAAHLTVVTTSHILALATQMPDRAPSHSSLLEIIGMQGKAAMEAEKHLNIHTLISVFPESWRSACANAGAADTSAPVNATTLLTGAFDLPLACHTTPLMGVRASKALLKEWSAKQDGEYEFKLGGH